MLRSALLQHASLLLDEDGRRGEERRSAPERARTDRRAYGADLHVPQWKVPDRAQGRDQKRLGRSPNYADAYSCTFSMEDTPGEADNILSRLGINDKRHAKTEFDPYRDTAREESNATAITEFDPYRDGNNAI